MRLTQIAVVAFASLFALPAAAQGWIEYVNREEMFVCFQAATWRRSRLVRAGERRWW